MKRWIVTVGAVMLVAGCGTAAQQRTDAPATADGGPAAEAPAADELALAGFRTGEPMSAKTIAAFWGPTAGDGRVDARGYDLENAVRVIGEEGQPQVHAVTRTNEQDGFEAPRICAFTVFPAPADGTTPPAATTPCAPRETFNRHGVISVVGSAPEIWMVGLVPDGVDAVMLTYADGSQTEVPVIDNGVAVKANRATRSLAFDGPAGRVERPAAPFEG